MDSEMEYLGVCISELNFECLYSCGNSVVLPLWLLAFQCTERIVNVIGELDCIHHNYDLTSVLYVCVYKHVPLLGSTLHFFNNGSCYNLRR